MPSDGEPHSRSPGEDGGLDLRRFATGDAGAVGALEHAAISAARARGRADEDVDAIAAADLEDGGEFLLGIGDGRLIAMGALRHVTDAGAELNRMRVQPGFQRRGLGRAILARLEHRAAEIGYQQLRLDTAVTLTAAQRFYRSAGHREVGRGQLAGAEVVYFEKPLA